MENYNNTQELETLRQQVREFKARLDRQEIISERMLRSSMRSKLTWIRNMNIWVSIIGLFVMPLVAGVFHYVVHVSWPPLAALTLLVLGETVYNIVSTHPLRNKSMGSATLVTVAHRMKAFKRREQWQMLIEVPLLLLITVWIGYEAVSQSDDQFIRGLAGSALVGGFFGGCVAAWFYIKEMRKIDQIVRDIDDFQDAQPKDL